MEGYVTASGLTMRWRVGRNHRGIPVLHGYIGPDERLSCQLLNEPQDLRNVAERIVVGRLAVIALAPPSPSSPEK